MKTQKKLIKAIKKIDKKAAKYLKSKEVKEKIGYNTKATQLFNLFQWEFSPQGYDYWDKIDDELAKKYKNYV